MSRSGENPICKAFRKKAALREALRPGERCELQPLETPCDLSVKATWYFEPRRRGPEFRMLIIAKVLADEGNLQVRPQLPGEPDISGEIGGHRRFRKRIDKTKHAIQLEAMRQIDHGLEHELIVGIISLGAPVVDITTA